MRKLSTVALSLLASTIVNLIDLSAATAATAAESAVNPLVKEGFVDVPAGHLYYQDSGGRGEAVVFLHAGSGNCLVFENQIEPFVKAGFRFIAYDRAGQGRSTRAATGSAASDTPELQQVMDALGVKKFHIVGAAAGGGVGLQYTLGHTDRVLSITVSNSIGNVQDTAYTELGRRIRPSQFDQLPVEMRELGPSYRAANAEGVQRWLLLSRQGMTLADPGTTGTTGTTGTPDPARGSAPRQGGPGGPPAPGAPGAGMPGGGTPVTFAALEQLRVPTLLLTGDADMYTPPSVLRTFKQHMPRAEMFVIPESGHAAHWENSAEFNRRVLAFIRKHRTA